MAKKAAQLNYWLFKEEPGCYSYEDLVKDGETIWDGVTNNQARKNLRLVRKGDRVLYYHTGKEKAIVGEMQTLGDSFHPGDDADAKAVVVKVKAVKRWKNPVTLKQIKSAPELADWDLVRNSRLSIMPVSPLQLKIVKKLSEESSSK